MAFKSLSPVLPVDEIEPCLSLWIDDLGFENAGEVEHQGRIGFVMLQRDSIVVMYQSYASIEEDNAELGKAMRDQSAALYFKVDDIGELEASLSKHDVVMPRRKTFYGAEEIAIRDKAGHILTFASFSEDQS